MVSPFTSVTRPAKYSIACAAIRASATICATGLPVLSASSIASASASPRSVFAASLRRAARSSGAVRPHSRNASCAAAMAAPASSDVSVRDLRDDLPVGRIDRADVFAPSGRVPLPAVVKVEV
jgi:hypothetical protein